MRRRRDKGCRLTSEIASVLLLLPFLCDVFSAVMPQNNGVRIKGRIEGLSGSAGVVLHTTYWEPGSPWWP